MILDGRTIANHILQSLTIRVHALEEKYDVQPHLAVVTVGENPATLSYIEQKKKKAQEIGALVSVYKNPSNVTQEELQNIINFLQEQGGIHGIILQLPIPAHLDETQLINSIHSQKDVDGFVPNSPYIIPIAAAIFKLLEVPMMKETIQTGESYNEWLRSKNIVVMGKGKTGGAPIIAELEKRGVKPRVVDSQTVNPEQITLNADIIICAVGKRGVLTKDMIKKAPPDGETGVILLNVGMTIGDDEKFVGDYDEEEIAPIASWYTPTPGGVGPVNVACLMENLVIAAEKSVKA